MNKGILRSIAAIAIGALFGALIGYFIQPFIIGLTIGAAVGARAGGIGQWRKGALYGAIVGLLLGVTVSPIAVSIGQIPPFVYVVGGLFGVVWGALVGGITCRLFRSEKPLLW